MRKVLKSVIVSLRCSSWVKTSVILESDLRYLELYPCLELLVEESLPFKLQRLFFGSLIFFRFFARITDPDSLICNPYRSTLDSVMLSLKTHSTLASLSKSIYLLLMSFALALSTLNTGDEIIIFDSGAYFCLNDFRSLIALNISGVWHGAHH